MDFTVFFLKYENIRWVACGNYKEIRWKK